MVDTEFYICEGDLECPNKVELTFEEYKKKNDTNESILCPTCEPRYSHLTRKENSNLGWNDIPES